MDVKEKTKEKNTKKKAKTTNEYEKMLIDFVKDELKEIM